MGACVSYAIDFNEDSRVASLRRHLDRFREVRSLFAADYYPLTPWTTDPSKWLAFQFHDPDQGKGIVQIFRGAGDSEARLDVYPSGLEPDRRYAVRDWDQEAVEERTGRALSESGLPCRSDGRSNVAFVFEYEEVPSR